jgi:hypothetical protein
MNPERLVVIHSMKKLKKRGRKTATPKSPTSKSASEGNGHLAAYSGNPSYTIRFREKVL